MSGDPAEDFQLLQELVPAARRRIEDFAWNYLVGGAESETTVKRNRQALDSIAFRPRVLRDVSTIDCASTMLDVPVRLPVFLAPVGSLQDFHPDSAIAAARAAGEFGVFQMLSSACPPGLEETAAAAQGPKIFQLYVRGDRAWVTDHVQRAHAAGYRAFCLTVDTAVYSRRERDIAKRTMPTARRNVTGREFQAALSWADVEHVRSICDIPLVLKGIATAEDARLAVEHGVDVVYVSNHGGRQLDHGRGTMEVVPEVLDAVGDRAAVYVDGGFMRGTDVLKAVAMGVRAVGLGRLFAFAIAAGGTPAIVRMLELLEIEIRTSMGLLGVAALDQLDHTYLHPASPVGFAHVTSAYPLLHE